LAAHLRHRFLPTASLQVDYLAATPLGSGVRGEAQVLRTTRGLVFARGLVTADSQPVARVRGMLKIGALSAVAATLDRPRPPRNCRRLSEVQLPPIGWSDPDEPWRREAWRSLCRRVCDQLRRGGRRALVGHELRHSPRRTWDGGVASDVGTIEGARNAHASDINNAGMVVGTSKPAEFI
jgi:hypothetical protein